MNTCWAAYLQMSPKHFTMTTTVLLSLRLHASHMWLWISDCSFTQCILSEWLSLHNVFWMSDCIFTQCILNICTVCLQRCLAVTWLVPSETAAISAHVLCTPYNHASIYSVTLFKATYTWDQCVFRTNNNKKDFYSAYQLHKLRAQHALQ